MTTPTRPVTRIDPGIRSSWADPRRPFTLEGVRYQLDEGPDLHVLYAQYPEAARVVAAHFGPDWRPRDVFTAAVCHRFHLIWPP